MKLNRIIQCPSSNSPVVGVDLIIGCCGYEDRCTSLMQFYGDHVNDVKYKRALFYKTPENETMRVHWREFKDYGFRLLEVSPNDDLDRRFEVFTQIFEDIDYDESLTVLIDYSSMNRDWYSTLLLFLDTFKNDKIKSLECLFYYRIPKFDEKKDDKYAYSTIHPLQGFAQFAIPDKPLALIVGLGSEEKSLYGVLQFADVDSEFVHYYYTCNEHIFNTKSSYPKYLEKVSDGNKHEYRLEKIVPLFNSLCDLKNLLSETNRIVVISCGPKPFTLMTLVFAKIYNVDVWKLETNVADHLVVKEASDESVVFRFEYR